MARGEPREGFIGPVGFAFIMFSMAACLPLFFLGPIAYTLGLSLAQALAAALAGNLVVAVAMALNGHAGVAARIDFPRHAETVFGRLGAKLVVAMRGFVGALWFGVEAYNGALSLIMIVLLALGVAAGEDLVRAATPWIPVALALYLGSMYLVLRLGLRGIGWAAQLAGPLLLLYFAWLTVWLYTQGAPARPPEKAAGWLSKEFLIYLAIQTNWWATVAVNMSDLSRGAKSWSAVWFGVLVGMVGGQLLGTYLSYMLIAMTGSSLPHEIIAAHAPGIIAVTLGLIFAFLAPWTTDLTANLPPLIGLLRTIVGGLTWRAASLIAVLLGFVLAPWWALDAALQIVDYVTAFAASYGVLLGPILGPMIAAYWILREPAIPNPHIPQVRWEAMASLAAGIAASYLAGAYLGMISYVLGIPFPEGPTWYVGVAASIAAYLALKSLRASKPK
jgi:cytosine/uracil/thiamine/allantoin permease